MFFEILAIEHANFQNFSGTCGPGTQERVISFPSKENNHVLAYLCRKLCIFDMAILRSKLHRFLDKYAIAWLFCLVGKLNSFMSTRAPGTTEFFENSHVQWQVSH